MTHRPQSILEQERIDTLDMMRGLALLGILLSNSMNFQYGLFLIPDLHNYYPFGLLDKIAENFILIFAKASFYTLFSFLFGYGMAFLKQRLEQQTLPFSLLYWRRMFILLIVGYLHGLFIWDGDILFMYALSSFLLFFFLKLSERGLLIWSFLFLMLMALSIATPEEDDSMDDINQSLTTYSIEEKAVLATGAYTDVISFRLHADPLGMGWIGDIIIFVPSMISVLGMFLLGAYVARKKWLIEPTKHLPMFKRIWWITLCVGFPSKLAYVINDTDQMEMLHSMIGGPMIAMFYATSIVLIATTEKGKKWLKPLTYVGRLSLTNYLLQSIVFTSLFYGYGLGLFGSIGYFFGVIISLLFFTLQILGSKWWLHNYYVGPFEWFWRAGTYLRFPKLKR
ncbi:DUF418 domain-containing protein [Halalkalibacter urbisdiaboli]|uniref:DUF418 domain-containing protein n=1 Tax=Halalkalibacter urbisdiaboli TaxID=1960589 RepID=UPI000B44CC55|nr:DUF418 domain-containing protein [Halalkalibacter urbisdiaboli]